MTCSECDYWHSWQEAREFWGAIVYEPMGECSRGEYPDNCIMNEEEAEKEILCEKEITN